jgi:hypothetical protein
MRIFLVVACAAAFVFSAWSNTPTSADGQQGSSVTINPVSMTGTATSHLFVDQADAY